MSNSTVFGLVAVGAIVVAIASMPQWQKHVQKEAELAQTTEAFRSFDSSSSSSSSDADSKMGLVPAVVPPNARKLYRAIGPRNPLNNVLLTDIRGDPNRLPAPPAFAADVWRDTHKAFQDQMQLLHPDQPNIIAAMYGDVYENHQLETGLMRQMYSMPSTRVLDDRDTFQKILSKGMFSGKDSGPEAAEARRLRTERHIMR